jgi:hypothetical protein
MNLFQEFRQLENRRHFLGRGKNLMGHAALASLLGGTSARGLAEALATGESKPGQFPAKAKHIIYLHMVGGPSQMDLWDYKPQMQEWYDKDLPESVRNGQRLTTMTAGQTRFPIAPSKFRFSQVGSNGLWMNTEMLPWTSKVADDLCLVRSMHTEAINHEPAICAMQTGNQVSGRPCIGSWVSYGLGSLNQNLPAFVVLVAEPTNKEQIQAISARLWSSGYLPGEHSGVSFRSAGDPILFINNPPGIPDTLRRSQLDGLRRLNEITHHEVGDPETHTRIQQFEMAFRMHGRGAGARLHLQTVRRSGPQARFLRLHRAPGPSLGRAGRAFRAGVPQQLGPPCQYGRPDALAVQGHRSGLLRVDHRPQAARPLRRHAHHLGW